MSEFLILAAFVVAVCATFLTGGLSVMVYIYITQGKQAAVEFFKREF